MLQVVLEVVLCQYMNSANKLAIGSYFAYMYIYIITAINSF